MPKINDYLIPITRKTQSAYSLCSHMSSFQSKRTLCISPVQLITFEEDVWAFDFTSSQLYSSRWRSTCQGIYSHTHYSTATFHTSTCLPGHTFHFSSKRNAPKSMEKPIQWEEIWPSNKHRSPACAHLRTVTHSASRTQTQGLWNYHLHKVMM